MVERFIFDHGWLTAIVWALVYASDYYLTILSAHLYRQAAAEHIVFEGSFELTPYYQKDVNALRRISPRFFFAMGMFSLLLLGMWLLATLADSPQLLSFFFGLLIGMEGAIHLRHMRNLALFWHLTRGEQLVSGKIAYTRRLSLQLSAAEFVSVGVFLFLLALVSESWFVLGGGLSSINVGLRHWIWARRLRKKTA